MIPSNSVQQQLTFDGGITNVPSDATCPDNALEESVGMVYDNGEHKVIQAPAVFVSGSEMKLLYVHSPSDTDLYIGAKVKDGQTYFVYCTKEGEQFTGTTFLKDNSGWNDIPYTGTEQVTSIGKTLIISTGTGLRRFLWTGSGYKNYDSLPELKFEPYLYSLYDDTPDGAGRFVTRDVAATKNIIHWTDTTSPNRWVILPDQVNAFNDAAIGLYAKLKNAVCKKKGFSNPFLVMAALKLYDDSYTMFTNPILMMTSIRTNNGASIDDRDNDANLEGWIYYSLLRFTQRQDYREFSDIIKGVTIFCTDGIETADTTVNQTLPGLGGSSSYVDPLWIGRANNDQLSLIHHSRPTSSYNIKPLIVPRAQTDIDKDIKEATIFYELCTIGLAPVEDGRLEDHITSDYLETLTTRPYLKNSDYYSHNELVPQVIYAYNSRLNLANIARSYFKGFSYFMPLDEAAESTYHFIVTIKTDSGNKTVVLSEQTKQVQGIYFFYPDSRATHVTILKEVNGSEIICCDADLKEHPSLNAAVYYAGTPTTKPSPSTAYAGNIPTSTEEREQLPNYIIQSEVNNPFVFQAEGYYKVAIGKILAITSTTHALSQGQFGQYPLLVFSDRGISAMSVGSTGIFISTQPMSREVCINPQSITQTDGAIFFASQKGLMVVVGNEVKCVTTQIQGQFVRDLSEAIIAYDYRDSLLWIINNKNGHSWVYSMNSGTLHRSELLQRDETQEVYEFFNQAGASSAIDTEHTEGYYESDYYRTVDKVIQYQKASNSFYMYIQYQVISSGSYGKVRLTNFTGHANYRTQDGHPREDVLYKDRDGKMYVYKGGSLVPPSDYISVTNNYPDSLIQSGADIYSLVHRVGRDQDEEVYAAKMVSRPLKLGNGTALKSIMQTKHVKQMQGTVAFRVFGSNDLTTWKELLSLRGVPWKYYRFSYDFEGLSAADTFAGTLLVVQERRTNKLR